MSYETVQAQHTPATPTEEEMTATIGLLNRWRDAVIEGSKLAVDFREMRKQLDDMKHEITELRSTSKWMDEQLVSLRKQRDDVVAEAGEAKAKLHEVEKDRDQWSSNHARISDQLTSTQNELLQARKDRDDEAYRNLELSEELEKVKAKLAKVMAVFSESETSPKAAEIARPAQAEPSHDPVPMSQASGDSPLPPRNW